MVVSYSGSGFRSAGATRGRRLKIGMRLIVDDYTVGTLGVLAKEQDSHQFVRPPASRLIGSVGCGRAHVPT